MFLQMKRTFNLTEFLNPHGDSKGGKHGRLTEQMKQEGMTPEQQQY